MISLRPLINKSSHFQTLGGIILLIKVKKNRKILDKIAGISSSKFFSKLSVPLVYILLAMGLTLVVVGTILSFSIKENVPVTEYLALPGINPEIPIVYGLIAFAISLVIHEMFHGIVARKHGVKVNSVGLMLFVVPIGAFVEPDEEEITKADPVVRRRIVGAGIAINFVIAIIAFLLFSLALSHVAVQTEAGAYVDTVLPTSSVYKFNVSNTELVSFDHMTGNNLSNLMENSRINPGSLVSASFYNGNRTVNYTMPAGIQVVSTIKGYPAYKNISLGDYILSVDNTTIYNENILGKVLDNITPESKICLKLGNFSANAQTDSVSYINLTSLSVYSYYQKYDPALKTSAQKNESFIGVSLTYSGLGLVSVSEYKSLIFGGTAYSGSFDGVVETIALPFDGLSPIPGGFTHLFTVPLGFSVFWFFTNTIYWLFWVNILLAITNALPVAIFDGSQFLRDTLMIASRRERFKYFRNEKNIANVLSLTTTIILLMLMIEIIVPRII
jgi:membrane-associated protease RseP (regulator of RpoE activity)